MPHTIYIKVNATLQVSWLIHRILNFKEELYREILRSGSAVITDAKAVDRALEPVTIAIAKKRYLGPVSKFIEKASLYHDVAGNIDVQKLK